MSRPARNGFAVRDYAALPDGPWDPGGVTDSRNAFGRLPEPLLYLWVFERPDSLAVQLVGHGWTSLGPVHLLVGPEARVPDRLIRTPDDLAAAIARFSSRAGRCACPPLGEFERRASYRGYPINYLWCADRIWQAGFMALARRCRRVVVDVTAEEPPVGLSFELAHVFGTLPASDVVLLFDRYRGDLDVTLEVLGRVWRRSSQAAPPPLVTYSSSALGYLARATWGFWRGRSSVPLARRAGHHAGWSRG